MLITTFQCLDVIKKMGLGGWWLVDGVHTHNP